MDKYIVTKAPHLRTYDQGHKTSIVMRDLLIGLSPAILFALYKNVVMVFIKGSYTSIWNAIYPLVTLILCPLFSVLLEALCLYIMKKDEIKTFKDLLIEVKNGFGMFPGLFIVLSSPTYLPLWQLLLGVAFGEVVGKMLFGGFGHNIFNPALIGKAFMAFSFPDSLSISFMNSYEAVAGATPLTFYDTLTEITYHNVVSNYGTIWNFILGTIPGAFAETSVIAILIGYIYMSIRGTIDWKIPLYYVGTMFVLTFCIGLKLDPAHWYTFWYPVFQVCSGGVLFGAVFMATEPVTSPKTPIARCMYGLLLGVLTVLFRNVGSMPEGVLTALLTLNVFGLCIDQWSIKTRIGGKINRKTVVGLIVFLVVFGLLFIYDVVMGG